MLTIKSEELDMYMHSGNTRLHCDGIKKISIESPRTTKDKANISDRWGVKKAS